MQTSSPAQVESNPVGLDVFYRTSRLGCVAFLLLLLVAGASSGILLTRRLLQPVQQTTGLVGSLEERQRGARTIYGLTVELEQGQLLFLRLRNHGRILQHLQERPVTGVATIAYRNGQILSFQPTSQEDQAVREREVPAALLGATVLLSLSNLILLAGGSALQRWQHVVRPAVAQTGHGLDEEE